MERAKRKIFFRADAGRGIGYGHFIRSLALADMLRNEFECVFFTQSPSEYQQREAQKVCPLIGLPSDDSKFDRFLDCLMGGEIVVLDNYFYTSEYQRQIKDKGCKLVCIDDMHDRHYYADLIINQGLGYTASDYLCEDYTRFAFGLEYALLRKPFLYASENNRQRKDVYKSEDLSVLVSFGGSDFLDLTSKVIDSVVGIRTVARVIAIVGDSYQTSHRIIDSKVEYQKNLSAFELSSLFLSVDCAILPASTIMNEALACSTSIIGGYYIDNQEHDYYSLLQNNLIMGAGDYTDIEAMDRVAYCVHKISRNCECAIPSDIQTRIIDLFKAL